MSIPVYNTSVITAVAKAQQGLAFPAFIMGGQGGAGGTTYGLYKKSTAYTFALWRSQLFKIGQPFKLVEMRIPLSAPVAANMTIIPVLYFDDGNSSSIGATINSTNYPDSERSIVLTPDNFAHATSGKKNFFLELQFTGSALIGAIFPISIELETLDEP